MIEDNELRLVHREETFNDLAVRELARSRSACICRLQFGACEKVECIKCEIGHDYRACYNQMNDYDKTRLSSYVSKYYLHDSLYPGKWMSYKKLCNHAAKWTTISIICLLLLILPLILLNPGDKPKQISKDINDKIIVTIKLTQEYINDLNKDGKINCIDHACGFKMIWDNIYPELKDDCIIIRNKSLTMNHLFIGVYEEDNIIFVEPWTNNPYEYDMHKIWSYKWNPKYNKYDETNKWLSKVYGVKSEI